MMKFGKVLAASLALAMTLSLGACNDYDAKNIKASHPEAETVADFAKIAEDNMAALESYDMDATVEFSATVDGTTSTMNMEMEGSFFADKTKVVTTVEADGEKATAEAYSVVEDGVATTYMYDGKNWTATSQTVSTESADTTAAVDPEEAYKLYTDNAENFDVTGVTQIKGLNVTILEGTLKGDSIKDALETIDVMSLITGTDLTEEEQGDFATVFSSMIDAMADAEIPMTIYLQDANLLPVKYSMDLTDVLNKMVKAIATAAVDVAAEDATEEEIAAAEAAKEAAADLISVDTFVMTCTMQNFNNATDFEVPSEAIEAAAKSAEEANVAEAATDETTAADEAASDDSEAA